MGFFRLLSIDDFRRLVAFLKVPQTGSTVYHSVDLLPRITKYYSAPGLNDHGLRYSSFPNDGDKIINNYQ